MLYPKPAGHRAAWIVGLACLGAGAPGAAALDPGLRLSAYHRSVWQDALPQASVHALVQSAEGYLWLGTYEGLVRFDGTRFRVFDSANTPALKSAAVWCLLADRGGALWIGTLGGGLLRKSGERWQVWTTQQGLPSDSVYALYEDRGGALWVGTNRGIARLEGERVQAFSAGFERAIVRGFAQGPDGILWAATDGAGLWRFDGQRWSGLTRADGLAHGSISALLAEADGTLWLGTYGGLQRLRAGRFETWGRAAGLQSLRVWTLHRDRDGSLWVGTEGGGLHRWRAGRFEALRERDGLANDFVRALTEDREGHLWVGTNAGLQRLTAGKFAAYGADEGLIGSMARTVYQDRAGRLLVGTDGGGLLQLVGGRLATLYGPEALPNPFVRALAEDAEGALWIGTAGGGALRCRGQELRRYGAAQGLDNTYVRALALDEDGVLWAGTNGGLYRLQGERWHAVATGATRAEVVPTLYPRRGGGLWAGTSAGLLQVGPLGVRRRPLEGGAPDEMVFALYEDPDGTLWIGTGSGLARLRGEHLERFGPPHGLSTRSVFSIQPDEAGSLWLSGNKGVVRVPRAALEVGPSRAAPEPLETFGPSDGLPSRQCNGTNYPAAWRSRDGRLWYPTAKGLAVTRPQRLPRNPLPPPVIVEEALVDGRPMGPAGELRLPPGAQRLEVTFAVLNLSSSERATARYRLEGFEDAWREAGLQREIVYTALRPGTYELHIQGRNEDGVWNHSGARLRLRVEPRLHERVPFWVALAALALAGAVTAFHLRTRVLRAQRGALERLVEEKTRALLAEKLRAEQANRDLAAANRELERLSLLDPLTGLANRRQFDTVLTAEWRRAARHAQPLALVAVDLDRFKAFNDAYGHPAGDECLRRVAAALRAVVRRASDLAARVGGDEFALLLPGAEAAHAAALAEQLLRRVEELRIPHVMPGGVVTLSAGVACLRPGDEHGPQDLVAAADAALYRAKNLGRQRVEQAP